MALITYLTRIQFDFGALKLLESELQLLGIRRSDLSVFVRNQKVLAGAWSEAFAGLHRAAAAAT